MLEKVWWECKLVQLLWRRAKSKKTNKEHQDRTVCTPTLGHISRENITSKSYMHPMFTAALSTIARIWTQAKFFHRGTNKDEVQIYSGISLGHKKEQNNAICNKTNGPRDCQTESSQSDRGRQIPWVWKVKTCYQQTCLQNINRNSHSCQKHTYICLFFVFVILLPRGKRQWEG